jgi:hypothetical protein
VIDANAAFCAGCGAPLGPPTTVVLPDPPAEVPAEPAAAAEPAAPSILVTLGNRKAAYVGLVGAALAFIGAFQEWLRIRIAGFVAPGSAQTGWNGGDGRTIVMAAVAAGLTAAALWIGRRELWLKITLLITGGVTVVIAIVHMVDVGSKARDIEVQFGIPAGDVRAQVGVGLYLVVLGGVGMLVAGLQARTTS